MDDRDRYNATPLASAGEVADVVPSFEVAPGRGVLLFGSAWVKEAGEAAQPPARGGAKRRPNLERRTLNARRIPYAGSYPIRGRWLLDPYSGLRNAAWAVRNARVANDLNPAALDMALREAEGLLAKGEPLRDVLEAFAELLTRP
jgi:hypothetical protein